jgi:RNA recognition motif-containing protein
VLSCRRDLTPPEVRAAREKERELKELERATRTVFAFNLNIKADERDIFEFFSKAGEVRVLLCDGNNVLCCAGITVQDRRCTPVQPCVLCLGSR